MRYWWVNQNQTYRHEVRGGYLWSPKRKTNLAANPFYDFMREVAPGDVVFSFADTLIRAIDIAASHAYEAPKPLEFGQAGAYWDKIVWRLDMRFSELRLPIKPSAHMEVLKPLLPDRYAPLRANGAGLQNVYLARVPDRLAAALVDLLGAAKSHLLASHCKPWRDASNEERLDGENGLLLTPSIDHLFGRGFIAFEDTGALDAKDHGRSDRIAAQAAGGGACE